MNLRSLTSHGSLFLFLFSFANHYYLEFIKILTVWNFRQKVHNVEPRAKLILNAICSSLFEQKSRL